MRSVIVFARCRTIWNIDPVSSCGSSERVAACFLGITRQCPTARGLTSRNARNFRSSYIFLAGISPVAILQNMQSVIHVHLPYLCDCLDYIPLLFFSPCHPSLLQSQIRTLISYLILSSSLRGNLSGICLQSCS